MRGSVVQSPWRVVGLAVLAAFFSLHPFISISPDYIYSYQERGTKRFSSISKYTNKKLNN